MNAGDRKYSALSPRIFDPSFDLPAGAWIGFGNLTCNKEDRNSREFHIQRAGRRLEGNMVDRSASHGGN